MRMRIWRGAGLKEINEMPWGDIEWEPWQESVAKDLNLLPTGQDFGIINADEMRVPEFISYFQAYSAPSDSWAWEELADLVLQSVSDAMVAGILTEPQKQEVESILVNDRFKFPNQFEYWKEFPNEEGSYPVADLVRLVAEREGI